MDAEVQFGSVTQYQIPASSLPARLLPVRLGDGFKRYISTVQQAIGGFQPGLFTKRAQGK